MAETKKKRPIAWGAITWGTLGVAALARAFWRGNRSLIRDGYVVSCAGSKNCSSDMVVQATEDAQPVYSPVSGTVVEVTPDHILIVPKNESALLEYSAADWHIQVVSGERVGRGQQIALARQLSFSVYKLNQDGSLTPYEPASWLAVHGLRVSGKFRFEHREDRPWCENGRKLEVPQQVAQCGMSIASPSGYALLPVNIEMK